VIFASCRCHSRSQSSGQRVAERNSTAQAANAGKIHVMSRPSGNQSTTTEVEND